MEKKFNFIVDNSSWMRSVEYAYLKVQSPKGGYAYFYKWAKNKTSPWNGNEACKYLVLQMADMKNGAVVELTMEQASLLFNHACSVITRTGYKKSSGRRGYKQYKK